jgi:RNA polymerase sigma factor (sigma-70 family)
MSDDSRLARFEAMVLVHLDAAYGFARWLAGDEALAEDAVQEACLKALRTFESRTGPSAKAWFMAVVRNACLDVLRGRRRRANEEAFDEDVHVAAGMASIDSPETIATRTSDARWIRAEIARLPVEFREVVVLRELEELSYKEISAIVKIPIGTVMSRLSRGRDLLAERVRAEVKRRPG